MTLLASPWVAHRCSALNVLVGLAACQARSSASRFPTTCMTRSSDMSKRSGDFSAGSKVAWHDAGFTSDHRRLLRILDDLDTKYSRFLRPRMWIFSLDQIDTSSHPTRRRKRTRRAGCSVMFSTDGSVGKGLYCGTAFKRIDARIGASTPCPDPPTRRGSQCALQCRSGWPLASKRPLWRQPCRI